ncbi:hypothetical protein FKP32DRAFT_65178 [Trametes sanguinea]|nr:hypothetical protein FKP32DRAFT_65178 [Trametes sanguinea]
MRSDARLAYSAPSRPCSPVACAQISTVLHRLLASPAQAMLPISRAPSPKITTTPSAIATGPELEPGWTSGSSLRTVLSLAVLLLLRRYRLSAFAALAIDECCSLRPNPSRIARSHLRAHPHVLVRASSVLQRLREPWTGRRGQLPSHPVHPQVAGLVRLVYRPTVPSNGWPYRGSMLYNDTSVGAGRASSASSERASVSTCRPTGSSLS